MRTCPKEDVVALDPGHEHARTCAICREVAFVVSSLRRLDEADRAMAARPPDPRAVLLRARLVQRLEAQRGALVRTVRPIAWMDGLLIAGSLAALVWFTVWAGEILAGIPARILLGV